MSNGFHSESSFVAWLSWSCERTREVEGEVFHESAYLWIGGTISACSLGRSVINNTSGSAKKGRNNSFSKTNPHTNVMCEWTRRFLLRLLLMSIVLHVESAKYSSKYKQIEDLQIQKIPPTNSDIDYKWTFQFLDCVDRTGLQKCLKIFVLKRLDRVVNEINTATGNELSVTFDIVDELKNNFHWKKYENVTENEIDDHLIKTIKNVFQERRTKLTLHPKIIDIEVVSNRNGSTYLNIKKNWDVDLSRGMKSSRKTFYRMIPFLLIPPLIMSAILPFVLPAMKIMILGVGMLNQMALMGAIFTLMRNNAFQDSYKKKVIYVNDGWKNEKKPPRIVHEQEYHKQPVIPYSQHYQPDVFQHQHAISESFHEGDEENEEYHHGNQHFINSHGQPHFHTNHNYDNELDRSEKNHRKNENFISIPETNSVKIF